MKKHVLCLGLVLAMALHVVAQERAFTFSADQSNYVAVGTDYETPENQIAKVQLSLKTQILGPVDFSYTQKGLWAVGEPSAPFREWNYNPGVSATLSHEMASVRCGYEHESNGMDNQAGPNSRSWERFYCAPSWEYEWRGLKIRSTNKFWSVWTHVGEAYYLRDNPDIQRFQGRQEARIRVSLLNRLTWTGTFRKMSRQHEVAWSFGDFAFYGQYVHGFGQMLRLYNKQTESAYLGIALSW